MEILVNSSWPEHVARFKYKGREFEVWDNGMYFTIRNITTGREYFNDHWFKLTGLLDLYEDAVTLLSQVQ